MPGTDYKTSEQNEILFSPREAVAIVQVISRALGKNGGLPLEADHSQAVSRVLDEAAAALISDSGT